MKRWTLGLLVLSLCSVPASANSFGVFYTNFSPADTAASGGVGFDLEVGTGDLEFELRLSLYDEHTSDAAPEVFELEIVPIDFGVNYNFGGGERVHPYVGGGPTYAVFDFTVDVTTTLGLPRGISVDPEWGYYLQVGLDFEINDRSMIYAEAIYRTLEAEVEFDDLGRPIDQQVDLSGGALNLGFALTW